MNHRASIAAPVWLAAPDMVYTLLHMPSPVQQSQLCQTRTAVLQGRLGRDLPGEAQWSRSQAAAVL